MKETRPGEIGLEFDPGALPPDAGLVFIGRIRSPWRDRADCPKNMAAARERGQPASVEVAEPYRAGLLRLERVSHVVLLSWLAAAGRHLIVQHPRHAEQPSGTFALRSPVRPNPIGLHVCRLLDADPVGGVLTIDAIDVLDATPLLDIKPYFASTDAFPDARRDRAEPAG